MGKEGREGRGEGIWKAVMRVKAVGRRETESRERKVERRGETKWEEGRNMVV